jgi:hypothetical protein
MLTDTGRAVVQDGFDAVVAALADYGGPWAAPLTVDQDEFLHPDSGLLRKRIALTARRRLSGRWVGTDHDHCCRVRYVGLAATEFGEFLILIPIGIGWFGRGAVVLAGDPVEVSGKLTARIAR